MSTFACCRLVSGENEFRYESGCSDNGELDGADLGWCIAISLGKLDLDALAILARAVQHIYETEGVNQDEAMRFCAAAEKLLEKLEQKSRISS